MFGWSKSPPSLPIDDVTRDWVEARTRWIVEQFGLERIRSCPVILPKHEFFPDPYDGSPESVRLMTDRICGYLGIDSAKIFLKLYGEQNITGIADSDTPGTYRPVLGGFEISVEINNVTEPMSLAATLAHELCHIQLLGFDRVSATEPDHEPLTDLLTVMLGMGVFTSNSVIREGHHSDGQMSYWGISRTGYLTMPIYGYALARFAMIRNEAEPKWARELRPDVRAYFKQSLRYLLAHGVSELPDVPVPNSIDDSNLGTKALPAKKSIIVSVEDQTTKTIIAPERPMARWLKYTYIFAGIAWVILMFIMVGGSLFQAFFR